MRTETAAIDIAAPPEEVWALVGGFGGLDTWMAGVDGCVVDGDVRTVSTMGMDIKERLVARSDEDRALTYAIEEGAPCDSHSATISVADAGGGASRVTWEVSVEPDDGAELFVAVYQGALDRLKAKFEG